MRIDGFGDSYLNRLYTDGIPSADRDLTVKTDSDKAASEDGTSRNQVAVREKVTKTPRGNASLGDVKVSLGNRDSSLVGLGNLGGIQSSVMRKAVSDMQKDSVLHEYQYFVGNGVVTSANSAEKSGIIMEDEDGVVIRK